MKTKEEMRSGSKWRRSLMALAVLSAPVVSIAGFSGSASAGVINPLSVVTNCSGEITATLETAESKGSFYFRASIGGVFVHIVDTTSAASVTYENGSNSNGYEFEAFRDIDPVVDGIYPVVVTRYTRIGNASTGTYSLDDTFTADAIIDCDRPETDTFTIDDVCTRSQGILVTLTSKYNDKSPYDLEVSYPGGSTPDLRSFANTDFVEVVPNTVPKTYTATLNFLYGEGDYEVTIVHRTTGKTVKYQNTPQTAEYELICESSPPPTSGPGGGFSFTFKLPTTTPALPSTGSDSSTSLLVIAPMMVLLGAGLIAARRRLATV